MIRRYPHRPGAAAGIIYAGAARARAPQFLMVDREAELPSPAGCAGDLAFALDTERLVKCTRAGWVVVGAAQGGGGAHAASHQNGGSDEFSVAGLSGALADDQPAQAHALDGAKHTASGLTPGHVLRASGSAAFAFAALQDGDVPATIARDSEVAAAVSAHEAASDPHAGYQRESEKAQANGYAALDSGGAVPDAQIPASIARDSELSAHTGASSGAHTASAISSAPAGTVAATTVQGAIDELASDYAAADAAHVAAGDPHAQYQAESEKGQAGGYAGLDGSTKVLIAQVPTGSSSSSVCIGNDARLSDARAPTTHAASHQPGGGDPMAVDAAVGSGSLRTIGAGAAQACAGNDPRLSDSRAPNGSASGDLGGSFPSPTVTQARGLRETGGPTTLALGAVADGQYLRRVGSAVVGATPAGGGGGNAVEATITISDAVPGLIYSVTVTGQSWVTSTSKIVCSLFAVANGATTPELAMVSGIVVMAGARVDGVGFDIYVYNPNGAVGTFTIHAIGVP